ncbi:MAG: hypothetical protein PQ612_07210 [Rickettsiales bacterium]|nr:hypothetical protein [Pseudomonadota bacterium]MDA0965745.1 hypothetical protein [Pseudomonadota bacterium]MDG4543793.1 hypothetical protein [Rickettsiales bacterium]MDG4545940.1 hypothetical protein [Rickettsiales bacterium]MDG4548186.1 hypothetical protein [Rickettsiales bacterium]
MREDYLLSTLKSTQLFASEMQVSYDNSKQLYIGKFASARGEYLIEGPNRAEVTYEMDRLLQEEYRLMQKEVTKKKSFQEQVSSGRSRGSGGRSMGGETVHKIDASEANRLSASRGLTAIDVVTGGMALVAGRYVEAGIAAASLVLGDFFEGVESLWDKTDKVYAVSFGGVLITASTRRQLRRKLSRQKQKRLQLIMNHVRKMGLIKGASDGPIEKYKRENNKIRQLRKKKEKALQLGPEKWRRTVSPQGQQTGWRSRTLDLRERIKGKKALAEQLWVERIGTREKRLN